MKNVEMFKRVSRSATQAKSLNERKSSRNQKLKMPLHNQIFKKGRAEKAVGC